MAAVLRLPTASQAEQRPGQAPTEHTEQPEDQADEESEEEEPSSPDPDEPVAEEPGDEPRTEDVFGHDDQPVGTAEELDNGSGRLTLPTATIVAAMSVGEREDAAAGFIRRVRRHFGLEQRN